MHEHKSSDDGIEVLRPWSVMHVPFQKLYAQVARAVHVPSPRPFQG